MFKPISYLTIYLCVCIAQEQSDKYIENFTQTKGISQWMEHSDTVRNVGKSKASFVLSETSKHQRAVLFTLLNPQPCGAAFAGVKKNVALDLSPFSSITIKIRGQGSFKGYKLILKEARYNYSFCSFFEASENFKELSLPLKNFKPYNEGKLIKDPEVQLDLSKIISMGIQAYGGLYLPIKQSGVASLEIEWIKKD